MTKTPNRRTFVKLATVSAVAPALAGCTGGADSGNGNGNGDGNDNGGGGDVPQEVDAYLSDANEYDGSIEDQTGEDEVTIEVGTGTDGYGFSPAAVRVDAGTTVVWEWTGDGGMHNVVDEDGAFESEYYGDAGETFEHTFDETGDYTYYCDPHKSAGMKGGVAVR